MNAPYFEMTVPLFAKNLRSLKAILAKGAEHAKSIGMSEADLLNSRLAPDMFPLVKQVQIVTDNAKGAVARLGEADALVLPDEETTIAELIARIEKVEVYLATFTAEQFAGADERVITLPYYPGKFMTGHDYLSEFALANFFFHFNMSYAILRMVGVTLGKGDYIGGMNMRELV
jgi:uncharacterized protein